MCTTQGTSHETDPGGQSGPPGRPALVPAVIGLLMVCTPALGTVDREALMQTAARTHMAIVHIPIALIIAAAVFEAVRIVTRRDRPSPAALGCLAIAVGGAAMAATTGWWHADFERRSGEAVVELHRWLGIAGGSLGLIALILGLIATGAHARVVRRLYVLVVLIAAGTIGFAGHQGGEVTFGEGYVLEPLLGKARGAGTARPGVSVAVIDPAAPLEVRFDEHVLPIFEASCIECHGANKQKGELRLDALAALEASPYFGEVVVAGDAKASTIVERITLPRTDHDFMPKRGEPLSPGQIAIIVRWIDTLAPGSGGPRVSEESGEPEEADAGPTPEAVAVIAAVGAMGGHAAFESAGSGRLVVDLSVMTRPITRDDLAVLLPAAGSIVELDLGGRGVTDAMMPIIASFGLIERLNISRSAVTDEGIAALAPLARLRVLNVYDAPLTDAAASAIGALPALERVYIWRTGIGSEGRAQLAAARQGIEIIAGGDEPHALAPQPEAPAQPEQAADPPGE